MAGFIGSPATNFIRGTIIRDDGLHFLDQDKVFTLPVGKRHERCLASYEEQAVFLGVRPEDVYVAGSPHITGAVAEIDLLLDVMEPMGNEIFIYAHTRDHSLVARVAPQSLPQPGQSIKLAFDLEKLHFFDAETEQTIGTKAPAMAAA